jgi:serine/threonine protein kinase
MEDALVTDREDLCGRTLGEFLVRERIGSGGFGDVYRCEQRLLGRQAVIKVLHRRLRYGGASGATRSRSR